MRRRGFEVLIESKRIDRMCSPSNVGQSFGDGFFGCGDFCEWKIGIYYPDFPALLLFFAGAEGFFR
jgi:hypothetical protein